MDMNSGKLREMVRDREAWCAAARGVAKSWTQLGNWTATIGLSPLLGNLSGPVLWLKSIKSLDMEDCASPVSHELQRGIPDPITPGSPGAPSPPGFTGWGLCRHLGQRACCLCKPYLPNFFVRQAGEATPNVWREAGEDKATERTLRSKSLKKTLEHFSQGLGGWRGLSTSLTLLAFVTTSPAFQRVFSFAPSLLSPPLPFPSLRILCSCHLAALFSPRC